MVSNINVSLAEHLLSFGLTSNILCCVFCPQLEVHDVESSCSLLDLGNFILGRGSDSSWHAPIHLVIHPPWILGGFLVIMTSFGQAMMPGHHLGV